MPADVAGVTMQASLTSPYRAEIFTDQPIYEPGEQVTGRVIFTLRRKLQFDRLLATLRGEVRVKFEPKPDPKELLGYRRPTSTEKPILYENKRELINKTVELWSQKKAIKETLRRSSKLSNSSDNEFSYPRGLEAGVYTFHFSFQLPNHGLYTSFDAAGSPASVRYTIEVLTQYGDAEIVRGESLVAVVCPHILLRGLNPTEESHSMVDTKEIPRKGQVTVQLTLNRIKFLPGDPIIGQIIIHNRSKHSIKYSYFNIVQTLSCFTEPPTQYRHDHEIPNNGIGLPSNKVCAGASFNYPIQLNIPALVPQINVPNCLFTDYYAQLAVGFARNSPRAAIIHIKIPIEIGTQILDDVGLQMPTAPPVYDEILVH